MAKAAQPAGKQGTGMSPAWRPEDGTQRRKRRKGSESHGNESHLSPTRFLFSLHLRFQV